MVKKKGQSKRASLKLKVKINRHVKEHKRKLRKLSRKGGGALKKKKDIGIPNSLPFKNEVLAEIEHAKQKLEEKKLAFKEKRHQDRMRVEEGGMLPEEEALKAMVTSAEDEAIAFEIKKQKQLSDDNEVNDNHIPAGLQSRRAYTKDLRKVVGKSDVVLQVLDARDPEGCRSTSLEESVLSSPDKRLVMVLNKVDLAPRNAVEAWLMHLRKSFPTVAFKASTQGKGSIQNMSGNASKMPIQALKLSGSIGGEGLLSLLKNYCRNAGIKTRISVGVVGYPNVGKSSLINSLKRCKSVGVSSVPGFTKAIQEVHLDSNIQLLDCPGIVFDDSESDEHHVLLKNCVNIDNLEDPAYAVAAILRRYDQEVLMQQYQISCFNSNDEEEFLSLVARRNGKLLKGGIPDRVAAGRIVLKDWNAGRVPFFTLPPETHNKPVKDENAVILSNFSKEFNMDDIIQFDEEVLDEAVSRDEGTQMWTDISESHH